MIFRLFHSAIAKEPSEESDEHQAPEDPGNIGNILLEIGAINRSQLQKALEEQKLMRSSGEDALLGRVLVKLKACSESDIERGLRQQRRAHLPDSTRAHDAMDKLDKVLSKSEKQTEEMRTVTWSAMEAVKSG